MAAKTQRISHVMTPTVLPHLDHDQPVTVGLHATTAATMCLMQIRPSLKTCFLHSFSLSFLFLITHTLTDYIDKLLLFVVLAEASQNFVFL